MLWKPGTELPVDTLRQFLIERPTEHLGIKTTEIMTDVALTEYGLNSVYTIAIAAELEDDLDLSADPKIMRDNPSIDALSQVLREESDKASVA